MIPLHATCLLTGNFCDECKKKIEERKFTGEDLKVLKAMVKIANKVDINSVEIFHCFEFEKFFLILTISPAGLLIGRRGRTATFLSKELGKRVRVVSISDFSTTLSEILSPVQFKIGTVYEGGKKYIRIYIKKESAQKLPANIPKLKQAISSFAKREFEIVFI